MARQLYVDNYIINAPLYDVLTLLKNSLTNGKLKDILLRDSENILVTCPNREHSNGHESHPDMNIYIGNNPNIQYGTAHCFACGWASNFVKFVAECFELSEDYAKHWLISNFGVLAYEKLNLGDDIRIGQFKTTHKNRMDDSILSTYQDWCPYLQSRGLTYDTCVKFNIKYDPKYRHVIFPCYDNSGNLIMLPWRSIDSKQFYLDKNVEKPLYLLDYITKNNLQKVIITEGPFDALLANQYGFPAIATLGSISTDQIAKLNKSNIKVLYTMFDNDAAGKRFTEIVNRSVTKRILITNISIPSPHKDIGELSYEEFWDIINKTVKN